MKTYLFKVSFDVRISAKNKKEAEEKVKKLMMKQFNGIYPSIIRKDSANG